MAWCHKAERTQYQSCVLVIPQWSGKYVVSNINKKYDIYFAILQSVKVLCSSVVFCVSQYFVIKVLLP